MHVFVLYCNTMHDHGTESRGHVLFRVTRGNTSAGALKQGLICFNLCRAKQTLTISTLYQ